MGYSTEHKTRTRERIIESAGRLFRRYGYNGVGIDDIMAAAHLTRGGFYAHFRSKEHLFAATLAAELELARHLRKSGESSEATGGGAARAVIDFYLDGGNRKRVAAVCPLVSLSADVARVGDAARAAYTATLQDMLTEMAQRIPGDAVAAQRRALAAIALCVGGVVLAQALSDGHLADLLLATCRERALAEVEGSVPRGA